MHAQAVESNTVHRLGHADDVAAAILFVAANKFATGSVVTVDGGGSLV